jgi:hypothetical protein
VRNWSKYVIPAALLGLFIWVVLAGRPKPLTAADTVTPRLTARPNWVAGRPGHLEVRLEAKQADGATRVLDFVATDPEATVTFYQGDAPLGTPTTVTLSHRC